MNDQANRRAEDLSIDDDVYNCLDPPTPDEKDDSSTVNFDDIYKAKRVSVNMNDIYNTKRVKKKEVDESMKSQHKIIEDLIAEMKSQPLTPLTDLEKSIDDLPQLGDNECDDDEVQENNSVENLKSTEYLLEKDHDSVERKNEMKNKYLPGEEGVTIDDDFSEDDFALLSDIEDDIKVEHVQDDELDSTELGTQKLFDLVKQLERYSCTLCDFKAHYYTKLRKHIVSFN